jgi:hypothetical protein
MGGHGAGIQACQSEHSPASTADTDERPISANSKSAAILADDARLAIKYPGIWQRRPESLEYVAVSSVGFNDIKTKAVVYVRKRSSGGVHVRQFVNGEWVVPQLSKGCGGWIA